MDQAEVLMQRHITVPHGTPDPNLRKEPFIRDKQKNLGSDWNFCSLC
jgi:hypothetical protein